MKKVVFVFVLILAWVPCYGQVTYAPRVIDMKPGAGGWVPVTPSSVPMTRNIPALVQSGVVKKILLSKINTAGLVVTAGSMWYEVVKERPEDFPQVYNWLDRLGLRPTGGGYSHVVKTATPNSGSDVEACVATARAEWMAYVPSRGALNKEIPVAGQAGATALDKELRLCGLCTETFHASGRVYCGAIQVGWAASWGLASLNPYQCPEAGKSVVWYFDPVGTWPISEYTSGEELTPGTSKNVEKVTERDITPNDKNIPQDARKALDEIYEKWGDAVRNNTDMLNKNANSTEKLGDKIQQIMKNGIPVTTLTNMQTTSESGASGDDLTTPYQEGETLTSSGGGSSGSGSNAVCGAPPLPPCEVTGNWNDTQGVPGDLSNHNLDPNENSNVVGSTSELVSEQRGVLEAFLNQIWQAVNRLVGKIMVEVNRWIGDQQAGSCSVQGGDVFGGSFNLDFCPIDLTAWRQVIIAVFGMLSAVILVTKWRS